MYVPAAFAEDRPEVALALLRAAGFGHLVVATADGLASSPVPFLVDDELTTVRAHLARANPLWRTTPCDGLLVVPVTDAYVSPAWYASKAEHGRVVPTWNYEVVHLHGRLVAHDDRAWLRQQVGDLTSRNEAELERPWAVDDAPAAFVSAQLRAIVGLELTIGRVEAKRKLSQNRNESDRAGAAAGLRRLERARSGAVADAMEHH